MVIAHVHQEKRSNVLWWGTHSGAACGGSIESFVRRTLEDLSQKVCLWMNQSDGLDTMQSLKEARDSLCGFGGIPVIATLSTRLPPDVPTPEVVICPLDDVFFSQGVVPDLNLTLPQWREREAVLFWRGRRCGERDRIIERLATSSHADVGFSDVKGWAGHEEFLRRKFVAIVDGNVISSAHMWCFAIGAVPVLVTHPHNRYWFKSRLVPFVNYVPLRWDLEDFDEIMFWMLTHDRECEAIAAAALRLAQTFFTAEYQQDYLRTELERAALAFADVEYLSFPLT